MVANAATIERIKAFGIRKLKQVSGIDDKTLTLICRGKPVKPRTLRKLVHFSDAEEKRQLEERDPFHADTPDILPDLREKAQVLRHDLIKNFGTPEQIEALIIYDQRIRRLEEMTK